MRTIGFFRTIFLCTALSAAVASAVAAPREVTWQDLQPASLLEMQEKAYGVNRILDAMPENKREKYEAVQSELDLRVRVKAGFLTEENMGDDYRAMLADPPSKKYPDALAFWEDVYRLEKEILAERKKPNNELNGQSIRMPGYVLPLEFDGDKVTEFLLVPYVGACIHSPAPPGNQMVFVKADKSFVSEGLFAPVWVEGVLTSESVTRKLDLVDGSDDVEASYTMNAVKIEDYKR